MITRVLIGVIACQQYHYCAPISVTSIPMSVTIVPSKYKGALLYETEAVFKILLRCVEEAVSCF